MYHIYDKVEHEYLKRNCTLQAIIDPGHWLTDDEVRKYFGIDEGHRYWSRAHLPTTKFRRLVFDKIIIPDTPRFRLETVHEEEE